MLLITLLKCIFCKIVLLSDLVKRFHEEQFSIFFVKRASALLVIFIPNHFHYVVKLSIHVLIFFTSSFLFFVCNVDGVVLLVLPLQEGLILLFLFYYLLLNRVWFLVPERPALACIDREVGFLHTPQVRFNGLGASNRDFAEIDRLALIFLAEERPVLELKD